MGQNTELKRAVITGATGMIGATLAQLLLAQGIRVTALIRPGSPKKENLQPHENLDIVECALDQLSSAVLLERSYDALFHLGWMGTYGKARNDAYLQNRNITAALDAVTLAHRLGCRVFVGAGSQAEYGRIRENGGADGAGAVRPAGIALSASVPERPETGYGMAKLCAGQLSRLLCRSHGIRHVWTRFLSVYGPYDNSYTMVMSGIYQMLDGKCPSYTRGEQLWDYIYSEDAARAMYLAACRGRDGAVYCVGSGQVHPLAWYIGKIRDAAAPGSEIGLGVLPYPPGQVMYLKADISDLTKDTGFAPQISFEEGIGRTVQWCREEMKRKE